MDLERILHRWYKQAAITIPDDVIDKRWNGIQKAIEIIEDLNDISELIKMYLCQKISVEFMEAFVDCF